MKIKESGRWREIKNRVKKIKNQSAKIKIEESAGGGTGKTRIIKRCGVDFGKSGGRIFEATREQQHDMIF